MYPHPMESLSKFPFRALARNFCPSFPLWARAVVFFVVPFLYCLNTAHAESQITFLYPVYHSDADRIINEIRDGAHEYSGNNINEIAFDTTEQNSSAQKKVEALSEGDTVVTLTMALGDFIRSSGFKGRLIEGASDNPSITGSTVSVGIDPSPVTYIESLIRINPEIEKIFYFTFKSNGKTEAQEEAAKLHEIANDKQVDLKFISVDNLDGAMHRINEVISGNDPATTAMWIPNRILSMSNNTVLKYVLREAWGRSFIVFTDSLDAVARGLLFSLIPDYQAYGKYLGRLAEKATGQDDPPVSESIRYFDDVYLMLNQRFSVHIGLNINRSVIEKYKIVVPAK